MALKTLLMRKRIDNKKKELEALKAKDFSAREAELTQAIEEVETEEQRTEIEEMVTAFDAEKAENEKAISDLEREIEGLENDLAAEEEAQNTDPPAEKQPEERKDEKPMKTRESNVVMTTRDRLANLVTRDEVKDYLAEVRNAIKEKRAITGVGLLIPDVMLELIRYETARASRLLPFVNRRAGSGVARQNISGVIPEAVWTEMCANLNEVALAFNQIEVDGYKVGAYMAICNASLEDSDIALANEIVTTLGGSIAKALDKAILFGTGTKMPTGIVTRLKQESQPASWGTNAPAWVDLHSTNILTLNIGSTRGAEFFESLLGALGVAKPVYNDDGLFWVMNRKTHMKVIAKAMAFDSSAALVANTQLMPVIGGTVVEFEDTEIQDNTIYGGFGGNYLLAERAGIEYANSDIPLFLQDQTVFKATARYDGMPLDGAAFVVVNFNNTSPTTSATFPDDWANVDLNELTIVAAASGSNAGKTVLTVTDYLADSTPVLYYKLGTQAVKAGDVIATSGTGAWASLTSGTTEITAAAGKKITVVELNAAAASGGRVVSAGVVASVPKSA